MIPADQGELLFRIKNQSLQCEEPLLRAVRSLDSYHTMCGVHTQLGRLKGHMPNGAGGQPQLLTVSN
jgi:hypothetical protein